MFASLASDERCLLVLLCALERFREGAFIAKGEVLALAKVAEVCCGVENGVAELLNWLKILAVGGNGPRESPPTLRGCGVGWKGFFWGEGGCQRESSFSVPGLLFLFTGAT